MDNFANSIANLDAQILSPDTLEGVRAALSIAKTTIVKQHIKALQADLKAARMLLPVKVKKPAKAAKTTKAEAKNGR